MLIFHDDVLAKYTRPLWVSVKLSVSAVGREETMPWDREPCAFSEADSLA